MDHDQALQGRLTEIKAAHEKTSFVSTAIQDKIRAISEAYSRQHSGVAGAIRQIEQYRDRSISGQIERMMEDHRRQGIINSAEVEKILERYHREQMSMAAQAGRIAQESTSYLNRQLREWDRLAKDAVRQFDTLAPMFSKAHSTWAAGMESFLKMGGEDGLSAANLALRARVDSLSSAYSTFCDRALRDLGYSSNERDSAMLLGSVNLAGHHFSKAAEVIRPLVTGSIEMVTPSQPVPLRLYEVQKDELSASSVIENPEDIVELTSISPAADTAARVLKMLRLIPEVNQSAQLTGRPETIKTTSRMFEAAMDLVGLVPMNKSAFADFIDRLYWLFYEGAGKDKLRYLSENGGPYSKNDCEVIWAIKVLRNKWYRHDPDHGDASDIRRSYRTLQETLERFGFKHLPHNAADYRQLHSLLINELVQFLTKLRDSN